MELFYHMAALIFSHMWPVTVVPKRVFLDVFCAVKLPIGILAQVMNPTSFRFPRHNGMIIFLMGSRKALGPQNRRIAWPEGTVRVF